MTTLYETALRNDQIQPFENCPFKNGRCQPLIHRTNCRRMRYVLLLQALILRIRQRFKEVSQRFNTNRYHLIDSKSPSFREVDIE